LSESKDIHNISVVKYHNKYSEELEGFDIALLTLRSTLNDTLNRPICLFQSFNLNKPTKELIAGWDKTGFYE